MCPLLLLPALAALEVFGNLWMQGKNSLVSQKKLRDDTHMTSMKIVQFSRPLTLSVHLLPKSFLPLHLARPISSEPQSPSDTMIVIKLNQNKKKQTSYVTFKLTMRSIVRFSPQTMQWCH